MVCWLTVVIHVTRQEIRNNDDYRAVVEKAKLDQEGLLLVNPRGSMLFISLKEMK